MHTIYELITLDVQSEHDLEHDLEHKKFYSTPKIYDGNGDLSKRWYVYFSYRNPKTGKLERVNRNIYGKANLYKTKEARYSLLSLYKKRLLKLLKEGYNPFGDNTELHNKRDDNTIETVETNQDIPKEVAEVTEASEASEAKEVIQAPEATVQENLVEEVEVIAETPTGLNIKEAFDQALNLKTNVVSARTLRDYKNYCDLFQKWLAANHQEIVYITDISKKIVTEFLNDRQLKSSARNRNNYRTCLSTIFQVLEDNELIERNFIKNISILKSNPERNRTYTLQQEEEIFKHLEQNDRILLLFIKFISYNFLRPIEVCRLRVKDINIEEKFLEIKVKNKPLKMKIIPQVLLDQLPDLKGMDRENLLFTPDGIGAPWDTELTNRRDYFSKRFKTIVKDHFDLGKNYGLYSFRHTSITKLYRALAIKSSPFAAKSQVMQITGHSTMVSLEKYLRDIDAELPEDYSKYIQ